MPQLRARIFLDAVPSPIRELLSCALCMTVCTVSVACKEASAAELMKDKATLPERSHDGTVHWNVQKDGDTRVVVTDDRGSVVRQGVTGQLKFFLPRGGDDAKTVNLELDSDTGVLHADGPDLDDSVTEIRYALLVNGKARTGVLHVPESGTKGLRDSADAAEKIGEAKGPHGGAIQVAGEKRYEVLADSDTGEVRVYLLDANNERPKKVKLALDAESPKIVELEWHAEGYYVAELDVHHPPRKVTLVVDDDDDTYVVLVGYRAGVVLVLDAPPVFWVHPGWDSPGLARGHYKGTIYGPPGQYDRNDRGPDKVMIKSKGGQKVHIKVH